MAKFSYNIEQKEAVLAVKRALNGKVAILKDTGNKLVVGSPMMTVDITFENGTVTTKGSLVGKVILGTVDSCIEIEGNFTKL